MKNNSQSAPQDELKQISARLGELNQQRDIINGKVAVLQEGAISSGASLDDLHNEVARLGTVDNLIRVLEEKRHALQSSIDEAQRQQERQQLLETVKGKADRAEKCFNDYTSILSGLDKFISETADRLADASDAYLSAKNDYKNSLSQIDAPTDADFQTVGLTGEKRKLAAGEILNLPELQHAEFIRSLESFATRRRAAAMRAASAIST